MVVAAILDFFAQESYASYCIVSRLCHRTTRFSSATPRETQDQGKSRQMTTSLQQWTNWISALEVILQEADLNHEHLFGIHLNSAIEVAERQLAGMTGGPKADQPPPGEVG